MKYSANERLEHLIGLAYLECGTKDAELFDDVGTAEVVIPKGLDRKVKRVIERGSRINTPSRTRLVLGRIAIAAMLIMSIILVLLISISGIREAIWRAIVEWHENYITIRYEQSDEDDGGQASADSSDSGSADSVAVGQGSGAVDSGSSDSSVSVTPPTKILEVRKPSYVVDGAVEDMIESKICVSIDYIFGNEIKYSFSQFVIKENQKYFDNEGAKIEQLNINENKHIANVVTYDNNTDKIIVWNDGEYVYVLSSPFLNVDEMIRVAESVKAE